MKKLMSILIVGSFFIGCATKSLNNTEPSEIKDAAKGAIPELPDVKIPEIPNITKPTAYYMGISEEEFKSKNDGLEVFDQNKDGIVYMRRECSECNPKYYIFINGELKTSLPFWGGFDKIQF